MLVAFRGCNYAVIRQGFKSLAHSSSPLKWTKNFCELTRHISYMWGMKKTTLN
jgi:hypothetical protein